MSRESGIRVPPGRAGMLVLRRRLAVAEAGASLLARKLTMLAAEADRLTAVADAAAGRWHTTAAEAQRWLVRAAQLDGERTLRHASPPPSATVAVTWTNLMGLRFPTRAACTVPVRRPDDAPAGGTAVLLADAAVREAVEAAAQHAAAVTAARVLTVEIGLTRQRLRALEHRVIPRLREVLRRRRAQVEELETADAVRRRWVGRVTGPAPAGPPAGSADPGENGPPPTTVSPGRRSSP